MSDLSLSHRMSTLTTRARYWNLALMLGCEMKSIDELRLLLGNALPEHGRKYPCTNPYCLGGKDISTKRPCTSCNNSEGSLRTEESNAPRSQSTKLAPDAASGDSGHNLSSSTEGRAAKEVSQRGKGATSSDAEKVSGRMPEIVAPPAKAHSSDYPNRVSCHSEYQASPAQFNLTSGPVCTPESGECETKAKACRAPIVDAKVTPDSINYGDTLPNSNGQPSSLEGSSSTGSFRTSRVMTENRNNLDSQLTIGKQTTTSPHGISNPARVSAALGVNDAPDNTDAACGKAEIAFESPLLSGNVESLTEREQGEQPLDALKPDQVRAALRPKSEPSRVRENGESSSRMTQDGSELMLREPSTIASANVASDFISEPPYLDDFEI